MTPSGDQALQARLQALFLDELDEQMDRLESGLESLAAAEPEVPVTTVAELFRSAHSLKGAAQAVGASAIASLCHDLEEELAKVRDGETDLDSAALARLNRLADGVARHRSGLRGLEEPTDPVPVEGEGTAPNGSGPPETAEAGMPAACGPVTRTGSSDAGPIRVAGHKIDTLMEQAGDLLTASYGSEKLVDQLGRVEERLQREEAQRQHERDAILSVLAGHQHRGRIAAVLDQADERARTTARDVGEILDRVSAHQKSLRIGAASFADAARRARMVPFEHATSGLHRQVRELSGELRKQAELEISASDVEVDKELVLTLREVLGHLVRNALDHGLEAPADRVRAGKPPRGRIRIGASLGSDGVHVEVSDDGSGVDEAAVREAASKREPSRRHGTLTLAEAMFAPGVSTAPGVSRVSGRGVGLDAVRATVEATGGSVSVRSERGVGTTLNLRLPLNLSTMRALLVRAGDQLVAVPSASVQRLVPLPKGSQRLGHGAVVGIDDEIVPFARLSDVLGWDRSSQPSSPGGLTGLVASSDVGVAVIAADEVLAEREIVLRASSSRLSGVRKILGTAQLDDGGVVLVLNPQVCLRAVVLDPSLDRADTARQMVGQHTVLLAEDSLTTRELERGLLEAAGFSVVVAHDGQQAWDLLKTNDVDAVVSDVNMPRMDGIALCRAIRASTRLASLPVVLVTSLHSDADRRAGLDAGADAYLTKAGFNRDDLVEALERLL